jgi:hypothetical protein
MVYLLGMSYRKSQAGKRAGVHSIGIKDHVAPAPEAEAKLKSFLSDYLPIWEWLLANADVTLAVDAEAPRDSIWGWMVTSGPGVVHAAGCKRSVIAAGFGPEIVGLLLGDRWTSKQVMTLELPQFRVANPGWKPPGDWLNLDRPSQWALDPSWLAVRVAK